MKNNGEEREKENGIFFVIKKIGKRDGGESSTSLSLLILWKVI